MCEQARAEDEQPVQDPSPVTSMLDKPVLTSMHGQQSNILFIMSWPRDGSNTGKSAPERTRSSRGQSGMACLVQLPPRSSGAAGHSLIT